jgi:DNA-binding transcriptional regulator YiaG
MNIRQIRQQLNLTQQQLAVALGVSVSTVARWESGYTKDLSNLAKARLEELIQQNKGEPQ